MSLPFTSSWISPLSWNLTVNGSAFRNPPNWMYLQFNSSEPSRLIRSNIFKAHFSKCRFLMFNFSHTIEFDLLLVLTTWFAWHVLSSLVGSILSWFGCFDGVAADDIDWDLLIVVLFLLCSLEVDFWEHVASAEIVDMLPMVLFSSSFFVLLVFNAWRFWFSGDDRRFLLDDDDVCEVVCFSSSSLSSRWIT